MSHHFDSPTAIADGRINLCDLFVFPGAPGTTTLILTVNPDAGRSSATTFRPDALYEFVVASDGGTREDIAFRVSFTEPDNAGNQQIHVRRADGFAAGHGTEGTLLGEGRTGEVFSLGAGGVAWAGLAADPFTADGLALARFLAALAEGRYDPGVFTSSPGNVFAGRDVTAIALQVPDAGLGGTRVAVWARISLVGHAPQLQVSRIGQAMLRPLFFSPPDTESETLNTGVPASDRDAHGKRVHGIASAVARLAGRPDPDAHADNVQSAFLPDVLTYQPGRPASFQPGSGNGRPLDDNTFDIAVAVLAGSTLGTASVPRPPTAEFPYLSAPQPADLPALADLFGLREHTPQEQSGLSPDRASGLPCGSDNGRPVARGGRVEPFDTTRPNIARVWDYWLGGKDNFAADRELAEKMLAVHPVSAQMARENRQFLGRAVGYVAARGVRQFIDVGAGLPTVLNTHDIARHTEPDARVAYVDNDPIVISHARSLLAKRPGVIAVPGDMRDPRGVLADPGLTGLIDLAEPACVIMSGVLHFADPGTARDIAAAFAKGVAPGSYLIISCGSGSTSEGENFTSAYTAAQLYIHSRQDIESFFGDLELVPPGVVSVLDWSGDDPPLHLEPRTATFVAGVARKAKAA